MFSPDIAVILYRGPFLLILYIGLLAINLSLWQRAGVNYIRIFDLKPGRRLIPRDLLRISLQLWIIWMFCVTTLYLHSYLNNAEPFTFPLVLICVLAAILLNPLNMMLRSARFWILKTTWRIVCAPFYDVKFADFWLGDQLVSMAQVFRDLQFSSCFFLLKFSDGVSTVPDLKLCMSNLSLPSLIAGGLPSWFRAAQCIRRYRDTKEAVPHLANTLKYSFGLLDVVLVYLTALYSEDSLHPYIHLAYLINKIIQTLYSYYWDISMDWGLISFNSGCFPVWTRQRMLYKYRSVYVLAMVEDFLLRFCWLYAFVIKHYGILPIQTVNTIAATLEIIRRIIWNLIRVENEHVNNCGEFRDESHSDLPLLDPEDYNNNNTSCKTKKKMILFFNGGGGSDETKPLLPSRSPRRNSSVDFIKPPPRTYNSIEHQGSVTTCKNKAMVGASHNIILPGANHNLLANGATNNLLMVV